jgi:hypothetical protein
VNSKLVYQVDKWGGSLLGLALFTTPESGPHYHSHSTMAKVLLLLLLQTAAVSGHDGDD